ncbi:MAG: aminopeptidase P family protein [Candidatus Levybacteria bacterium]|nr:aminopeptidase P family protein [Candidatus Levybacteria bacterium]
MITHLIKLRQEIAKNKLDAALISSVSNIIYLTKYSGFSKEEREAYLFITQNQQYILTDGRYAHAIKTLIPNFKLIEISSTNSAEDILKKLKTKHKIKRLGVEENNLTHKEYKELSACFNDLPAGKAGLNHFSLNNFRAIKNGKEISAVEKACKLGDKTFAYILKKIKLGVSEKGVANEIEFFIKKHGADISFRPIVAFGKNSAIPHHVSTHNSKLLTHNSIILLDFGVKLNNYCSDMTRTVFFGKPSPEQKRMYKTVLQAQKLAIESLTSDGGRLSLRSHDSSEVDRIARDYIISKGYSTIPHSLGHGIGIDVHESPHLSPNSKDILKEGMVFSIEPGIYSPNFGGVRIEDLVVLEKNNVRLLTHSPKGPLDILS